MNPENPEKRYVIRNNYSGAYIHKTLFRILSFMTRDAAFWYMRRNGLKDQYYKVVEIYEKLSAAEK